MIKSLTIENFKTIEKLENLKLDSINIFVGKNGSGKSAIIDVLKFFKKSLIEANSFCEISGIYSDGRQYHATNKIRTVSLAYTRKWMIYDDHANYDLNKLFRKLKKMDIGQHVIFMLLQILPDHCFSHAGGEVTINESVLTPGLKKFAMLTMCIMNPYGPNIIMVDEIERGLSIEAQKFLADRIIEAKDRIQIITNTNSETFMNCFHPDDFIYAYLEDGKSKYLKISDAPHIIEWNEKYYTMGQLYDQNLLNYKQRSAK